MLPVCAPLLTKREHLHLINSLLFKIIEKPFAFNMMLVKDS